MTKYRKKPIVIEAFQWFPHLGPQGGVEYHPDESYHIPTLEGNMLVSDGDWIITGVNGEKYPCKPDIFEKSYEPAGNNEPADWYDSDVILGETDTIK